MDHINTSGSGHSLGLGSLLHILWRRSWVIVLIMGLALGISYYVSTKTPSRWKGSGTLRVLQRGATLVMSDQGLRNTPAVDTPDTQIVMLQLPEMAVRAIQWMKRNATDKGEPSEKFDLMNPAELQRAVTVGSPKGTDLVQIEIEGPSRAEVIDLINGYCEAFIQWKTEEAGADKGKRTETLEARTAEARRKMLAAEQEETAYKQAHRLADVDLQQSALVKQYIDRDSEVKSAKQELQAANAKVRTLGEQLGDADSAIKLGTGVRDDSLVLGLQSQLSQLEIERAQAALKFTAEYPGGLTDLDARINDVKDRLQKAIQGTLDNKRPSLQAQGKLFDEYMAAQTLAVIGEARLKSATAMRDQVRSQTASIPRTSMEYSRLRRNTELTRELYSGYQKELNHTRLVKDTAPINIVRTSLDPYVPQEPFLPDKTRDLAFGGFIGLFLAMISVLLLEQADDRVRNMETARRIAPGPVVGALPKLTRSQMRSLMAGNSDMNSIESFSLARANLSLVHRQNSHSSLWGKQVVLVTSAVPGEGKSLTAFQMARSMARAGRQVILVDADMRRPSQNKLFNTDEPSGLADVLSGEMTLDDALVATDLDNLLVLHSGAPDLNPTDLISSERMITTLAALREESDVVVVDTPACSVVADALLLAPYADCILHVIGAGQVGETLVSDTAAALQAAAPKTLAFFVNRAPSEKRAPYSNYYRYVAPADRAPVMRALPPGVGATDRSSDA
jgi:polysaccharide biosynthesis transport protein